MKQIAFINPNSTEAMTLKCAKNLKANLGNHFKIRAITNRKGPPAIQGEKDGENAIHGLLNEIKQNPDCDCFVIGCFDDTGVDFARELTQKPVIGIGQASFHLAVLTCCRFTVITTLPVSVPIIQKNIIKQGFENACNDVIASGLPVLELEHNPDKSIEIMSNQIAAIEKKTAGEAIILGCAGMTNIFEALQSRHQAKLIDPILATASLMPAIL
jgi:allantoin racemase